MDEQRQKVLVIVGPTASGKSALAVEVAKRFGGEVISADSRQVYRGLDIGTGKITRHEMQRVRHHLLDVASPKQAFTAHDFVVQARAAIADIASRGKLPIVVGGTGFYIDALLGRITLPDVPANESLRARLEKKTPVQLFTLLKKKDPRRAAAIDPHNKRRLIRALEIACFPARKARNLGFVNPNFDTLWVGLDIPKSELGKKIALRLTSRMKKGMLAEAKRLHEGGLSYKRMEELGLEYRYLARHLQGALARDRMVSELAAATRQYAKRQMTYWRRNKHIRWHAVEDKKIFAETAKWLG